MESTDQPIDHLAEAALAIKVAGGMLGAGHLDSADRWMHMASTHAQIGHAEQTRRLADLFDPSTDRPYASVEVDGHVTTGAP